MAINITTLCTRLGKLVGGLNDLNTWRQSTLATRFDTIDNQYESADQELVDGLYTVFGSARGGLDTVTSYYSALASDSIIKAVYNDRPEISRDIFSASTELLRQFTAADTFKESPTAATVTHVTTVGDTNLVALTPGNLVIPDTYVCGITTDSERGATQWQEPINVTGTALADFLGPLYPQGSGVSTTIITLDGATDVGLTNGSLSDFTVTNTPDNWIVTVGTIGVNVREASSQDPRGGTEKVLRLTNAATVTNDTVGLTPATYVTWSIKHKKVTNNGGTLTVKVAGTTVLTKTVASMSTSWETEAGIVKLATTIGTAVDMEVSLAGGGGTDDIYVSHAGVQQVFSLYPLGCFLAAWSGITAATVGDTWTVAVALSSGSMTTQLLRGIDRLVGWRYMGLEFPTTSGVATQPDSLVS